MTQASSFALDQARQFLADAAAAVAEDAALEDSDIAILLGSDPATCETMELLHLCVRAAIADEAMAETIQKRKRVLTARQSRFEVRASKLRGAVLEALQAMQLKRVEQPDFTAYVSKGREGTDIIDAAAVPERFKRIEVHVDLAAVKAARADGEMVPGTAPRNPMPYLVISTR